MLQINCLKFCCWSKLLSNYEFNSLDKIILVQLFIILCADDYPATISHSEVSLESMKIVPEK